LFTGAYAIIVLLTWGLVIMNVRSVVMQFTKDHNFIRLYSFLTVLLIMGSLVIGVASAVIQRALDAEAIMNSETKGPIRYYRL
jgi:FtsH-binding integral membrane protein